MRRLAKVKPVHVMAHPSLYEMMQKLGNEFKRKSGVELSQIEATKIIADRFKIPKIPDMLKERRKKYAL